MMAVGIDEYTVEGTFTVMNEAGSVFSFVGIILFFVVLFLAFAIFDQWKKRARRVFLITVTAVVAATVVTTGILTAQPDFQTEATERASYLVVTGTPVWSEVIRDADTPSRDRMQIRVDEAQDWLLEFTGSDIDQLVGRTDEIQAQCRVVSDSRMKCVPGIVGVSTTWLMSLFEEPRTWGEPRIEPYRP